MAYQGRKVFQAGEVLTASDLNSTVDQTVMVFADSTARDTAIPTPVEGMICYLESDNSVLKYDGSDWVSVALDINLDADRAVITNAGGDLVVSDVTAGELGFLDGVTSNVQTQLDGKQDDVITTQGDLIIGDASGDPVRLAVGAEDTVLQSNGTTAVWAAAGGGGGENFVALTYNAINEIDVNFPSNSLVRFAVITTSNSSFSLTLLDSSSNVVEVVSLDVDNPFTYFTDSTAVAKIAILQNIVDEEVLLVYSDPTASESPDVVSGKTTVVTSTQSVTLNDSATVYVFGGGGGGAGSFISGSSGAAGGGGGSGFFATGTISSGTYTATIGARGDRGSGGSDNATSGGASSISTVSANGGNAGGFPPDFETGGAGGNGGSGGGGGASSRGTQVSGGIGGFDGNAGNAGNAADSTNVAGSGGTGSSVASSSTQVQIIESTGPGGNANTTNQIPAGFYAGGGGGESFIINSVQGSTSADGFAGGGNGGFVREFNGDPVARFGGFGKAGFILIVEES